MAETMMAVRKIGSGPGAEICEVPIPKPGPREVLVKVKATSICGTDVHIYTWNKWSANRIKPPMTFGHECAGEVIETGEGVEAVEPGDSVSAETHIPCGRCFQCRTGNMHLCKNLVILGVDIDGTFAEYVIIPEICCWKNDSRLSWEIASIQEPFGNATYTVMESNVSGKTVAILGDGPIAAFANGIAHAVGAARVLCTGRNKVRLDIVGKMGTTELFDITTGDPVEWIMDRTGGEGVDVVLDMVGIQDTVTQGLEVAKRMGTYTAFGIPSGPVEMDLAEKIIFKGLRIIGINGRKMFETWYQMSHFLNEGLVDPAPVITHRLPLASFHEGMNIAHGENIICGKVVFLL